MNKYLLLGVSAVGGSICRLSAMECPDATILPLVLPARYT